MPRQDGTPTIKEILTDCGEGPVVFRVGHAVRFKAEPERTSWVTGTVESRVEDGADDWDASYNVRLADGSVVVRDGSQLDDLEAPRDPDKPWPPEQDCTHCPGKAGPDGVHAFGCDLHGVRARQPIFNATLESDGTYRIE